ncbi:MAG: hypothetical protein L7S58_03670 [Acidimicrobiales bacterium]|nr:hypothetical protein [Acidimicrobiales bacterium]
MKRFFCIAIALLFIVSTCGNPDTDAGDSPTSSDKDNSEILSPVVFEVLNLTGFDTSEIQGWADHAAASMFDRRANILAVLYPIGENLGDEDRDRFNGAPFTPNEVVLSQVEIEDLLSTIEMWLSEHPCTDQDGREKNEQLKDFRLWLEEGADASTQRELCERLPDTGTLGVRDTRVVFMGLQNPREYQTMEQEVENLQRFFFHEIYHALQQDLRSCPKIKDGEAATIAVEGSADYFSYINVGQIRGERLPSIEPLEKMLKEIETLETWGQFYNPDLAILLLRAMIENGYSDDSTLTNGSLFHNCVRSQLN